MMHSVDFLILGVLKEFTNRIKKDDYIINDIFQTFNTPAIKILFKDTKKYIQKAKEVIQNGELSFSMPYPHEHIPNFHVMAISSGHEDTKFLNDFGYKVSTNNNSIKLKDFKIFSASKNEINTNKCVSRGYKVRNKFCESWEGVVKDIIDRGDNTLSAFRYTLILDKEVPFINGVLIQAGYQIYEKSSSTVTEYKKSLDNVSVTLILRTVGSYETHYVLNQYIRFLIKGSRSMFESNGFQNMSISYSEISPISNQDLGGDKIRFQSTFHITGQAHDEWVAIQKQTLQDVFLSVCTQSDDQDSTIEFEKERL